ncbi:hypothetical protein H8K33_01355 [Undibacterium amnicola]|uniref:Uncharacterized protein n=1 Tax=Undibacterium amnicola TaxID=1834038 RepID=A0ABR6XKV6_9BURK|nr:hypothetical protein [Undibacterium amnicola]MBC3830149.1 hypothetical protein [Undibacterium amnicola]
MQTAETQQNIKKTALIFAYAYEIMRYSSPKLTKTVEDCIKLYDCNDKLRYSVDRKTRSRRLFVFVIGRSIPASSDEIFSNLLKLTMLVSLKYAQHVIHMAKQTKANLVPIKN